MKSARRSITAIAFAALTATSPVHAADLTIQLH